MSAVDNQPTQPTNFFKYLKNESKVFETKLLTVYGVSGFFHFLIIAAIIVSASAGPELEFTNLLFFILAIAAFVRVQKYSMDQSNEIVEKVVTQIRLRLADKIRRTDLPSFEQLGQNRMHNLLTQELQNFSEAAKLVSRLFASSTLLVVAFLYIAFLSAPAFVVALAVIIIGVEFYRSRRDAIEQDLMEASKQEENFFDTLDHLLQGFKEVKINEARSNEIYHGRLQDIANTTESLKIGSTSKLNSTIIFAQTFSYILIGIMIFIFPKLIEIPAATLIQIVTLILFITTGPLQEVVGSFPHLERANVAVRNLQTLEAELERVTLDPISPPDVKIALAPFQLLECVEARFQYNHSQTETPFGIGPLTFSAKRGEIVFLMGGNGAGKSTFLKTLTGLYFPTGGRILLNGEEVDRRNVNRYRAHFSVIFQDMHLFDRLYGIDPIQPETINAMLKTMQLADKTGVTEDGRIENINLSMGQKKRLALIVAELEDREILIFDEWAADQDPIFRRYFYEEYLPSLKRKGKTVIAVTHDDRYYHAADRLYMMEYGTLMEVEKPKTPAPRKRKK